MRNAASLWPSAVFLREYADRVEHEGTFYSHVAPVDKLIQAMNRDNVKLDGWNSGTMLRYLQVGRRLSSHMLKQLLIVWETFFVSNLRFDVSNGVIRYQRQCNCLSRLCLDEDLQHQGESRILDVVVRKGAAAFHHLIATKVLLLGRRLLIRGGSCSAAPAPARRRLLLLGGAAVGGAAGLLRFEPSSPSARRATRPGFRLNIFHSVLTG